MVGRLGLRDSVETFGFARIVCESVLYCLVELYWRLLLFVAGEEYWLEASYDALYVLV